MFLPLFLSLAVFFSSSFVTELHKTYFGICIVKGLSLKMMLINFFAKIVTGTIITLIFLLCCIIGSWQIDLWKEFAQFAPMMFVIKAYGDTIVLLCTI